MVSSKTPEESLGVELPCSIMTNNKVSSSKTTENTLETVYPLADVPSSRLNDKTSKMDNDAHSSEETMVEVPKVLNSDSLENILCCENKVRLAMKNEARPAIENETRPAIENEARPAVENEARPAVENEARPAVENEARPAVENEARPAVENEARPAVENEARPAVENEARPAVENEARPAVENEARPAVENEARPAVENEERSDAESEVKPMTESGKIAVAEESEASPTAESVKITVAKESKSSPTAEEREACPTAGCVKMSVPEESEGMPTVENEKMAVEEESEASPDAVCVKMAVAKESEAMPAAESEKMAIAEQNEASPAADSVKMTVTEETKARPVAENECRPAAESEKMAIAEETKVRPVAENECRPATESEKMAIAKENKVRPAADSVNMSVTEESKARPVAETERRPAAKNEKLAVAEENEASPAADSVKMTVTEESKARPAAEREKMAVAEENEESPAADSVKMIVAEESKARPVVESEKMEVAEENEARPAAEFETRPTAECVKMAVIDENKAMPIAENGARLATESEKMVVTEESNAMSVADSECRPAAGSDVMAVTDENEARPTAECGKMITEESKIKPTAESEKMDITEELRGELTVENEVAAVSKGEPAVESEKLPVADKLTVAAENDAFLVIKNNDDDGNHKVESGTYSAIQTVSEVKDCIDRSEKTLNLPLPGAVENNEHGSEICPKPKTDIFKSSVVNEPIIDINAETAIADRERVSETESVSSCGVETSKEALASPGQPVGLQVTENVNNGKPGVGDVPENIEVPSSKAEKEFVALVSTETRQSKLKLSPVTDDGKGTRMEIEKESVGACVSEPFVDVAGNSKIQEASENLVEMGAISATVDSATIPEMSRESGVPNLECKLASSVDEPEEKLMDCQRVKPERNNEVTVDADVKHVENSKGTKVTGDEEMEVDSDDGTKLSAVTDGEVNMAAPLPVESEAGGKSTPQMEIGSDHTGDIVHLSTRDASANCANDLFVEEMDVDVSFEAKSNDVSVAASPKERVESSMETVGDILVERLAEHTSKEIVNNLQSSAVHNTGSGEKEDCKVTTKIGASVDEQKMECLESDGLCNQTMEPETSSIKQSQSSTNKVLARSECESADVPVCGLVKNGGISTVMSVHKSPKITEELQAERTAEELVSTEEESERAKDLQTGNTGAALSLVEPCAKMLSEGLTNKSAAENASEIMQPKVAPIACGENSANSVQANSPAEDVPNNIQPDAVDTECVASESRMDIAPESLAKAVAEVAQSNNKTDESTSATVSSAEDNASEVLPAEGAEDRTNSKTDNGISVESKTDSSSEPGDSVSVTTGNENFKDCKEKLTIVEQNGSICVPQSEDTESIKVKRFPVDSSHALNEEETSVAAHS